jgi:rhamnogalacturonan endolyase
VSPYLRPHTKGGPNTNGIDIDSTRNVLVEYCLLDVGDDGVCLKSGYNEDGWRVAKPTENVVVRNVTTLNCHGGIVIGSEISGDVRNVLADGCLYDGSDTGIRIKSNASRGDVVENIDCRNISVRQIKKVAIQLVNNYDPSSVPSGANAWTTFRNISIKDIVCDDAGIAANIQGTAQKPIENLTMENITITAKTGMKFDWVTGLNLIHVSSKPASGESMKFLLLRGARRARALASMLRMPPFFRLLLLLLLALALGAAPWPAAANTSGIGTTGADVTVKDNGGGTVTMANGIVSILIETGENRINSSQYTSSNSGIPRTIETLQKNDHFRWGGFPLGGSTFVYSLAVDPARNGGNYGDVRLLNTSDHKGVFELHYSMLRGSSGFYATATQTHRAQDAAGAVGAWGALTRVPAGFDWTSLNPMHNYSVGPMPASAHGSSVPDSAHELTVLKSGGHAGEFDDKFIYAEDRANLDAWGWSSVVPSGLNVGIWLMSPMEFSNGGPLKRDVADSIDRGLNEAISTGEVGMGGDSNFAEGEVWSKTYGPFFYYVNSVPTSVTNPRQAAQLLFQDALAQAEAEKAAWPYVWFKLAGYVPESGRGTVMGKLVIADPGNPHASAAGVWVGLEQQAPSLKQDCDFQKYAKPYQFWVKTDAEGSFRIPHVIAGSNYTLWAYGPGAAGTFLSQEQRGGRAPLELDVPAKPFAVTVTAGRPTDLGTVTWTPSRVGPTVFELGYPDRKADKFRHGEDYWVPEPSPKLGYPTPIWGGEREFVLDNPKGLNYTVGASQWARDWSYIIPAPPDALGKYQPGTGTITFNLRAAPASDAQASLYLACAGDESGGIVVGVNGANLGTVSGVRASPNPVTAAGFDPPAGYTDDSAEHFSDHGPFFDQRINFPGSFLHAGTNTLSIEVAGKKGMPYLMLDYLRLELTGYVPPAPAPVSALAGNGRNRVTWPVVAGATSYNIRRTTTPGSGYAPLATDVVGPVSGSGPSRATYTDTTALNGTAYSYVIQSVNPTGTSASSAPSPSATPVATATANPPPMPDDLKVVTSGHHLVSLRWAASRGAASYEVWRTTLHQDGVGSAYPLRTIVLDDAVSGTTYTDNTPTDGRMYSYYVQATNAAGTSASSAAVMAAPVPPPPAAAPDGLTGTWAKTRTGNAITLRWSPVSGAVGYVIYRASGTDASFSWPGNFLTTLVETTYTDHGNTEKNAKVKGLESSTAYSYQVTAVNAGGVSPPASVQVPAQ